MIEFDGKGLAPMPTRHRSHTAKLNATDSGILHCPCLSVSTMIKGMGMAAQNGSRGPLEIAIPNMTCRLSSTLQTLQGFIVLGAEHKHENARNCDRRAAKRKFRSKANAYMTERKKGSVWN